MSMRNLIALAGGILGFLIAGPAGFSFGFTLGGLIGAILFPETIKGPRVKDLEVQISTYGAAIPIVWGCVRIAGNVIWADDIQEKKDEDKAGIGQKQVTYKYYGYWSVVFCEGPAEIVRVWADSKQIWGYEERIKKKKKRKKREKLLSKYAEHMSFVMGRGNETPSPMMEAREGVGNVPSYKGLTRMDFNKFPLKNFGNRVPNINVELNAGDPCIHPWNILDEDIHYVSRLDISQRYPISPANGQQMYPNHIYPVIAHDSTSRNVYVLMQSSDRAATSITNRMDMEGLAVYNLDTMAEIEYHPLSGKITAYAKENFGAALYLTQVRNMRILEGSRMMMFSGYLARKSSDYPYISDMIWWLVDLRTDEVIWASNPIDGGVDGDGWSFIKPIPVTFGSDTCWYVVCDRTSNFDDPADEESDDGWLVWRVTEAGTVTAVASGSSPFPRGFRATSTCIGEQRQGSTDLYNVGYTASDSTLEKAVFTFNWSTPVVTTVATGLDASCRNCIFSWEGEARDPKKMFVGMDNGYQVVSLKNGSITSTNNTLGASDWRCSGYFTFMENPAFSGEEMMLIPNYRWQDFDRYNGTFNAYILMGDSGDCVRWLSDEPPYAYWFPDIWDATNCTAIELVLGDGICD